jgi:hypothetical protein
MDIPNINTGCPTMWSLPDSLPPRPPCDEVVTTITDYQPDAESDVLMLNTLSQSFRHIYLWPQGTRDEQYSRALTLPTNCKIVRRGLASLDRHLAGRAYVGTRLHAGIRAAQMGSACLVVTVDHRARGIARDTGFPVVERSSLKEELKRNVERIFDGQALRIPRDAITEWTESLRCATGIESDGVYKR